MAARILPDVGMLRQMFSYDATTGDLIHKTRPRDLFYSDHQCNAWNAHYAGKSAGTINDGYLIVTVFQRKCAAHRLIYKLVLGIDPPDELDHIDGNPLNNRFDNLRCVTKAQNMMNCRAHRDSRTGIKGVSKSSGKYRAVIGVNNRQIFLGRFDSIDEAAEARRKAEIRYFGQYMKQR